MRIGNFESLTELVNDWGSLCTRLAADESCGNFSIPNYLPDAFLSKINRDLKGKEIYAECLGSPFWSNLKGLVFDFLPGKSEWVLYRGSS
jgi:hypothetical protein